MKITVFYDRKGFFHSAEFAEESQTVYTVDELKAYLKRCFSLTKKDGKDFRLFTFRIEADKGYYMVIDKYDDQAEAFRTIYHSAWNSEESPVLMSQRTVTAWALDVWKTEEQDRESAA